MNGSLKLGTRFNNAFSGGYTKNKHISARKKEESNKDLLEDKWASDILRLTRERAPRPRLSFAVKGGYIGIKFAHPVALSSSLCKSAARS
jgi:hypothetical protein